MKKTPTQTLDIFRPRKEILYDIDYDKYYLKYENDTKLYNSNIFGAKTPQMQATNIFLGTYKDRILSHSMDKINFNVDNTLYRPQHSRFEGYFQFARPLVVPFTNVAQPKTKKYLDEALSKVRNEFITPKNQDIFSKKLNQGLHYYTGTINNISDEKGKNLFLKKINDCLIKESKANILNKGKSMQDSELRALKNIRKKIISNSTNIIHGRKLKQPSKKFIHKFKINYNIYFRNPILKLKETPTEQKDFFKELYNVLNKKEVKQKLNLINNRTELTNIENKNNKPKIKNIRYILSAHKPGNKSQTRETRETLLFEDKDNNSIEQLKNDNSISNDYLDKLQNRTENPFKTIENSSIKNYKHLFSKEYEQNKMIKSLDEKPKIDDYFDIHTMTNINKNFNMEKKLLTGYQKPVIKEQTKFRKGIMKFRSFIETYKKELELYKLVNPIRYKLSEEKEQKEIKYLKKKLEKNRAMMGSYSPRNE